MTRNRAWSLVVVLGAVNAGCAFNRPIPEEPLPTANGVAAPLTERWLLRAGRGMSLPLAVRDGQLYGVGVDRRVVAVDLDRGRIRWNYHLDGPAASGILFRNDTVYAGGERPGGDLVALAAATGRRGWKQRPGWIGPPLALVGDVIIVRTRNKGAYGVNAADGRTLWRLPLAPGRVSALPGGEGSVVFATLDSLYRVDGQTGRVEVRARTPGTFAADWIATPAGIVAGTGEGEILLLDPSTLQPTWRRPLDAPILVTPTFHDGALWVATQGNTVWRIDLQSGEATRVVRHTSPITAPLFHWNGSVLVGDAKGIVTAYDDRGSEEWRIAVGRPVEMAPIEYQGDLIVFGGRGDIHRFGR